MILTSDFNLNLLKFDTNTEVNDFLDLRTRNWFRPHILDPTRITSQDKPSLIDNIFLKSQWYALLHLKLHRKNEWSFTQFFLLTVKVYNQGRPLNRDLKNVEDKTCKRYWRTHTRAKNKTSEVKLTKSMHSFMKILWGNWLKCTIKKTH